MAGTSISLWIMGFSAGVAGLIYVGIGRLQEGMGLVPAKSIGYLTLIAAGELALIKVNAHPAKKMGIYFSQNFFSPP